MGIERLVNLCLVVYHCYFDNHVVRTTAVEGARLLQIAAVGTLAIGESDNVVGLRILARPTVALYVREKGATLL